jgi:hypothetical protein
LGHIREKQTLLPFPFYRVYNKKMVYNILKRGGKKKGGESGGLLKKNKNHDAKLFLKSAISFLFFMEKFLKNENEKK